MEEECGLDDIPLLRADPGNDASGRLETTMTTSLRARWNVNLKWWVSDWREVMKLFGT